MHIILLDALLNMCVCKMLIPWNSGQLKQLRKKRKNIEDVTFPMKGEATHSDIMLSLRYEKKWELYKIYALMYAFLSHHLLQVTLQTSKMYNVPKLISRNTYLFFAISTIDLHYNLLNAIWMITLQYHCLLSSMLSNYSGLN